MAGLRGAHVEEDVMQNPFMRVLRASFEGLYRYAASCGDKTTVLVPCAECLENESFNQVFMETHVLQATHVPGCFMNLLGQGVEIKDGGVCTDLGFLDFRRCEIMQTESMYDFGNTFCVLVVDKPLLGKYKTLSGVGDQRSGGGAGSGKMLGDAKLIGGDGGISSSQPTLNYLNQAPEIEDKFYDQLTSFRHTFVQVPGCEQSTAERIREIVGDTTKRLIRHHNLVQPTQQRQLDYQVSRNAYALLHSFVFPHLVKILAKDEKRLTTAITSFDSPEDLLRVVPGAANRGFGSVDVRSCSDHLAAMETKITPHEKIECINDAHSALQKLVGESARAVAATGANQSPVEITGDDVLSLFILAVRASSLKDRIAHIAYVEMYLQGAAGRSGSNEAARFEEAGYAVSALQAALQFFLEDSRRPGGTAVSSSSRGGSRASGSFASGGYPSAQNTSSLGAGGFRGGLTFHDDDDEPPDQVNSHLQSLNRDIRQTRPGQQVHAGGLQRR